LVLGYYEMHPLGKILYQAKWWYVSDVLALERFKTGDPLSPYLFLFCVEGFSSLLWKAQEDNELRGVNFGAAWASYYTPAFRG
jgi:hypothetical protein